MSRTRECLDATTKSHTKEMRDESRSKILLLELHIQGCQVGWREFCILSLMDVAQECCWVCSSLLGVSLQNVMYEATFWC